MLTVVVLLLIFCKHNNCIYLFKIQKDLICHCGALSVLGLVQNVCMCVFFSFTFDEKKNATV